MVSEAHLAAQERSVERLAELCQHHQIRLLQPSSYRVFDGSRATAYSEKEEPVPLGVRGQALWRFERRVRAICPRHVLLRFGWLLDDSSNGLLARFLPRAQGGGGLVLAVLKQLDGQSPLWGTYHYGGHETTTSLALGQAVLSEARNFRSNLVDEVSPQAHSARPDAAEEPQHAVLSCKKILHTFGIKPRAWRSGLPSLLDRYYRHV